MNEMSLRVGDRYERYKNWDTYHVHEELVEMLEVVELDGYVTFYSEKYDCYYATDDVDVSELVYVGEYLIDVDESDSASVYGAEI